MIEARVGFDYRRYFYTFHSTNNDMFIVGGAVDQTYAGSLSVAITLGGPERVSSGSSSSAEEAPPPSDSGNAPAKRKNSKRPKMEDGTGE